MYNKKQQRKELKKKELQNIQMKREEINKIYIITVKYQEMKMTRYYHRLKIRKLIRMSFTADYNEVCRSKNALNHKYQ